MRTPGIMAQIVVKPGLIRVHFERGDEKPFPAILFVGADASLCLAGQLDQPAHRIAQDRQIPLNRVPENLIAHEVVAVAEPISNVCNVSPWHFGSASFERVLDVPARL
jgi:hypothetical protein